MYDSQLPKTLTEVFRTRDAYEDELDSFSDVYNEVEAHGVTAEYRGSGTTKHYTYKCKESRIDSTIEGLGDAYIENEEKLLLQTLNV